MISESTIEMLRQLEARNEEPTTLQKAMKDFLKEELSHMLEVRVEKEYAAFENRVIRVTVKLSLDGEVISSDYISIDA